MPKFMNYDPRFKYYNPYQRPNFYNSYRPNTSFKPNSSILEESNCYAQNNFCKQTDKKKPKSEDSVWLDLFGIKLYFDDVLILSLLFFLYKEEVKDESLFLALVLLLIS